MKRLAWADGVKRSEGSDRVATGGIGGGVAANGTESIRLSSRQHEGGPSMVGRSLVRDVGHGRERAGGVEGKQPDAVMVGGVRRYLDLEMLPGGYRHRLKRIAQDSLGFDPWRDHVPEWCWERDGDWVERVPVHRQAGYEVALRFFKSLLGEDGDGDARVRPGVSVRMLYRDEAGRSLMEVQRAGRNGDLSEARRRPTGWRLVEEGCGEERETRLGLRADVDHYAPDALLVSAIRLRLAELRVARSARRGALVEGSEGGCEGGPQDGAGGRCDFEGGDG